MFIDLASPDPLHSEPLRGSLPQCGLLRLAWPSGGCASSKWLHPAWKAEAQAWDEGWLMMAGWRLNYKKWVWLCVVILNAISSRTPSWKLGGDNRSIDKFIFEKAIDSMTRNPILDFSSENWAVAVVSSNTAMSSAAASLCSIGLTISPQIVKCLMSQLGRATSRQLRISWK